MSSSFLMSFLPSQLDLLILTYYICYIWHAYVRRRLLSSLPVVIVGSTRTRTRTRTKTSQLSAYILSFTSSTLMSYFDHPPRFNQLDAHFHLSAYLLHFFNGEAHNIIRLPINQATDKATDKPNQWEARREARSGRPEVNKFPREVSNRPEVIQGGPEVSHRQEVPLNSLHRLP